MDSTKQKLIKRAVRHARVRSRVSGTNDRPRLSVFRSGRHIYAQIIDDAKGATLATASSKEVSAKGGSASGGKDSKTGISAAVGKLIGEKALAKNISSVKFDRGGFAYHGRVKALAEAARESGLKF
jgi:large subunit ribosomal protein L18